MYGLGMAKRVIVTGAGCRSNWCHRKRGCLHCYMISFLSSLEKKEQQLPLKALTCFNKELMPFGNGISLCATNTYAAVEGVFHVSQIRLTCRLNPFSCKNSVYCMKSWQYDCVVQGRSNRWATYNIPA